MIAGWAVNAFGGESDAGASSPRRDCYFADDPSASPLKRLLNGELGVQQNDSLANF